MAHTSGAAVAVVLAMLAPVPALAGPVRHRQWAPDTTLLSQARAGGLPDGPSCCGVVSHDERIASVMAFESLADDIAPGARRGVANVFAVFRRAPWAPNGSPWLPGRTVVVSRGLGGRPANGASFAPALSGDSGHAPRCIAFLSGASNLVRGDRNHRVDAFLADLRTRRITLLSRSSDGRQANADTTQVVIDGGCREAAFVTAATNLARGTGGHRQVYLRPLGGPRPAQRALAGHTVLISQHAGRPAAADADQLGLSRNGSAVCFVSAARNLAPAVANGLQQVWEERIGVSLSAGRARFSLHQTLVSQGPDGSPAATPAARPSADHDGAVVSYELGGQIVRATLRGRSVQSEIVSANRFKGVVGDAPSAHPTISDGGQWIFFESLATNLGVPGNAERPLGVREVYRWSPPALTTYADMTGVQVKSIGYGHIQSSSPAGNQDISARGNYMPFESEDPFLVAGPPPTPLDSAVRAYAASHRLAGRILAPLDRRLLRRLPGAGGPATTLDTGPFDTAADPRAHQVYLRYLGPQ